MAQQDADDVNITGGKITGLTELETADGTISGGTIRAENVGVGGNWTFYQSGSTLFFKYDGNTVLSLESNGHLSCENNITAFKTL